MGLGGNHVKTSPYEWHVPNSITRVTKLVRSWIAPLFGVRTFARMGPGASNPPRPLATLAAADVAKAMCRRAYLALSLVRVHVRLHGAAKFVVKHTRQFPRVEGTAL